MPSTEASLRARCLIDTEEAAALGGKHVIVRFQLIPALDTGTQFRLEPGDGDALEQTESVIAR